MSIKVFDEEHQLNVFGFSAENNFTKNYFHKLESRFSVKITKFKNDVFKITHNNDNYFIFVDRNYRISTNNVQYWPHSKELELASKIKNQSGAFSTMFLTEYYNYSLDRNRRSAIHTALYSIVLKDAYFLKNCYEVDNTPIDSHQHYSLSAYYSICPSIYGSLNSSGSFLFANNKFYAFEALLCLLVKKIGADLTTTIDNIANILDKYSKYSPNVIINSADLQEEIINIPGSTLTLPVKVADNKYIIYQSTIDKLRLIKEKLTKNT